MKSYSEKLKDPRWQRIRLDIFNRDEFACAHCGSSHATLHVHHLIYYKGRDPWDYEASELITLCQGCHEKVEEIKKQVGLMLSTASFVDHISTFIANASYRSTNSHHPPTPLALSVISKAEIEAKKLNHVYSGTEHILLALLLGERGLGFQILKHFNVDYEKAVKLLGEITVEAERKDDDGP